MAGFEEIIQGVTTNGTFVPILVIILILAAVLVTILWLLMIIDCAKRDKFRSGDRVTWILILVLVGPIGMILYYFLVMREEKRRGLIRR